jgi:hypothetical protein
MMNANMAANYPSPHTDCSSLLLLQNGFTTVIDTSCPISPSYVKCQKIPHHVNKYSFTIFPCIEEHDTTMLMSIRAFYLAALGPRPLSLLAKEATRHRSISTMGRYSVFSLSSDRQLKCQILLIEDITPHSCVGGSKPSESAYKRRNSGNEGKSTGFKKRKGRQKNNTVNDSGRNGNDENQNPGGARKALCSEDQEATVKRFACVFQKFNPVEYDSCASFILSSWDRVLQHLKRKHLLRGEHCPICRKEFKGESPEDIKDEHIRAGCQPTTAIETGRLIQKEYDDLTGVGPGDQVTKWLKGWAILFRGYPEPFSPFAETLLEANCNLIRRRIPEIVQLFRRNRGQDLTDGDLTDLGVHIVDEVERGRLRTTSRQAVQLTPTPSSTESNTMAVPLDYDASLDHHTPVPLFGSTLAILPNMHLPLLESQTLPVMHWPISGMSFGAPLDGSSQALATFPDSLDHFAVSQPPMFQGVSSSYEQDSESIFHQSFNAPVFQEPVDRWTQDSIDGLVRHVNLFDNPAFEEEIEDVIDFAEDGVPI